MRSSSRPAVAGFAAGLFAAVALGSMLGIRAQQPSERPKVDPRILALIQQIHDADDHVAEAQSQVNFWQQEMNSDDADVARLATDSAASPTVAFFFGRAQGLSARAANSYLDARLALTLCQRKLQALKADLAAP